jgi:hypothetical protein
MTLGFCSPPPPPGAVVGLRCGHSRAAPTACFDACYAYALVNLLRAAGAPRCACEGVTPPRPRMKASIRARRAVLPRLWR